jgi:hypothetical protein
LESARLGVVEARNGGKELITFKAVKPGGAMGLGPSNSIGAVLIKSCLDMLSF